MTANVQQIEKIASREATDWFLLLGEEPDDAGLRRDFEKWLSANPVNRAAWYAMTQASDAMDKATPVYAATWQPLLAEVRKNDAAVDGAIDGGASAQTHRDEPAANDGRVTMPGQSPIQVSANRHSSSSSRSQATRRFGRLARFGGLGVAMAASLFAIVAGPGMLRNLQSDYATGTAEIRTVMLEDGSKVTLAPESAITVVYSNERRKIRLLGGDSFFDVAANPERPFVVTADDVNTTVLGTGFEVLRGKSGVDVAVEHGRVRVDYTSDEQSLLAATLDAGQSVHVDWAGGNGAGQMARGDKPVTHVAPWRQKQLIARDQPLGAVVDQLRRYYAGKIVVLGDALSDETVTGVYNLSDPLEALYGVARAREADLWQVSPWLVIVSR
jgi:transmembrane sensor